MGDCFRMAAELLDSPVVRGRNPRLVHGVPRRDRLPQVRYWWAWVELEFGNRAYCVEPGEGRLTFLERGAYYERRMLHFSDARTLISGYPLYLRFTEDDARHEVLRTGTFGPWVEDPDEWI